MLTTFPSFSAFAQETSSKEQLTEKGELWQPESNSNALNFEGDLSIEELQSAKLNDEDTPEIVGQDNIEEKGHVNRLWEQEEDLNSIVFQNRDGTKTMYYYNYPVKYKDANGKIKDKSNKISQTSSGDYTNAENDINTYFPKKLNRNKGIELKFGEYVVEMAPDIKGNSGASRQTGHNKYFDPTEYVQYPNVFDESISLRYTPTFEGYKEDIVLSKYTGINEFSFRLYTGGLSLVMNEDGSYYLIDPLSGEIKTQIGDLVVYDSKPFDVPDEILNESVSNPTEEDFAKKEATLKKLIESVPIENSTSNELPNNLKAYSHQYRVETVKQDSEYRITVVVDEEYLTDSERVYPVYVDPTISVSGSGTGKTIQDAPIYANKPNTASGGNTYNVVGYQGSTYGVGRTLMKFPGLSSNSTYANLSSNQITSLQLHIYEGSGSTNNACIDLWQYNGTSWTESTARCNNVGWDSYSNNFTWNFINCSGWQTFNLTSMVATWKSSSTALNKGIMLKNYTSESSSGYSKHFMSTESSYKPYLTYTYVTNIPVSQVCIEPSTFTINVNDTMYLNNYVSVLPSTATNKNVTYQVADDSVLSVSSSGLVCTKAAGKTTVTVRSVSDSSKYAVCTIVVNQVLTYPDTLITDTATRNRIIKLKTLIDENERAYLKGLISYSNRNTIKNQLELECNVARADYIIVGNNPTSNYAYAVLGGSSSNPWESSLSRTLSMNSSGIDVIVVQRALEVLGYYEPKDNEFYGTFDQNTYDAASSFVALLDNGQFTHNSFKVLFNGDNISERTYSAMTQLNQFRSVHNTVAVWTAAKVGGTYKMSDNKINNGNSSGNYYGYADVLKDTGSRTYIWEVKPDKEIYYRQGGIGDRQLQRYLAASAANSQTFTKPLTIGYNVGTFAIPFLGNKYIDVRSYYNPAYAGDARNGLVLYQLKNTPSYAIETVPIVVEEPSFSYEYTYSYSFNTSTWGTIAVVGIVIIGGIVCVSLAPSTGGTSLLPLAALGV